MKMVLSVAICAALLGTGAQAQAIPDEGVTLEEIAKWLQDQGYHAKIETGDKSRYIKSGSGGMDWYVDLYDCEGNKCKSIMFNTKFALKEKYTAEKANDWNAEKRFLKSYVNKEGKANVEWDVSIAPGVRWEGMNDNLATWRNHLEVYAEFIGW